MSPVLEDKLAENDFWKNHKLLIVLFVSMVIMNILNAIPFSCP